MTTGLEIEINHELIKLLGNIPIMLRNHAFGRCLAEFSKPIASKAGTLATTSRYTRSRYRRRVGRVISGGWSRKYSRDPRWSGIDSADHYGWKVGRYGVNTWIGFKYPSGLKQQFVHPSKKGTSYVRYNWGKPGVTYTYVNRYGRTIVFTRRTQPGINSFPMQDRSVVRAFHRSRSTAEDAFRREFQKQIKEMKLG